MADIDVTIAAADHPGVRVAHHLRHDLEIGSRLDKARAANVAQVVEVQIRPLKFLA